MWVQDGTSKNPKSMPGLTRTEIENLNPSLAEHPLVPKDQFKTKTKTDVLISAGSHFAIVARDQNGGRTCVLDYAFKKAQQQSKKTKNRALRMRDGQTSGADEKGSDDQPDSDGAAASAPFKKKAGPLSISNIGLKYADKKLHINFTATFDLGPLAFSLIGFGINLEVRGLQDVSLLPPSLDGLSVAFEKTPLTIAGIFRHGEDSSLEYYAGGLIVGWVPYQLQAAGFYGEARKGGDANSSPLTSVFVFARLQGPLLTLEFAEISGVTGGFGYNSEVRVPTADQIIDFPFIKPSTLDGATGSALSALEKLTSPAADGWFAPRDNTYWAAAGMKIDAFEMIALDAVAVVQFGQPIKLGLFAVGLVDIPTAKSPLKFAHVELGIAIVIDLDYGIVIAEAQLSPNSYILHPDCHLTGGFALYYWFDAPHADRALIGDFVFTLGGYHQAFQVPEGYPNPPRLGISWSLGSNLSLTGEAYFAMTPKVCMGGGRLHAAYHAGPIGAWFDAFVNFLINYKPFYFQATASICVGVSLSIDFLFIHTQESIEVGADLTMWGPPLAGRVHVDIKVKQFDIYFGESSSSNPPVSLLEFYHLVLQASSGGAGTSTATPQQDEGHTFLAQSGLINDSDKPARERNQTWTVRGGALSLVVGCKMAIGRADQTGSPEDNHVEYTTNKIYARPMRLTEPLTSTLKLSITRAGLETAVQAWGMDKVLKSVPTGLWGRCKHPNHPFHSLHRLLPSPHPVHSLNL